VGAIVAVPVAVGGTDIVESAAGVADTLAASPSAEPPQLVVMAAADTQAIAARTRRWRQQQSDIVPFSRGPACSDVVDDMTLMCPMTSTLRETLWRV
jgi:hypothetical protein